ncbi:MAG: hypothetical protein H6730_22490 [Deltaproteobacteria bacterium]|nr:hypothetical protein [Deltaproteobacteria bacterium]
MKRSKLKTGLAGAGALAAGLYVPEAHADLGARWDLGGFVGWTFGGPDSGFTWGVEGRLMASETNIYCGGSETRPYGGGVLRVTMFDGVSPMLGAGLVGGALVGEDASAGLDLGLGYRFGSSPRLALWVGGEGQYSLAALRTQVHILDGAVTVAPTVRFPTPGMQTACYIIGRPLRSESGVAPLPGLQIQGEPRALDERERRVVDAWCQRARTEWASVPAFHELAAQLTLADAPEHLVQAARRAAVDETRHAVDSARMAARVDGSPVFLHPQAGLHRKLLDGPEARARLAVESYLDGCRQEGAAAACALAEAHRATDSAIQAVQARIAEDEAQHAELGWAVVAWLLESGDEAARAALEAALDAPPVSIDGDIDRDLEGFGVLSDHQRSELSARVQARARDRLARRLRA